MENQEYNPDILTLVDDEGNEHQFELIDSVEDNSKRYVALVPVYKNPEELIEDDGEFIILRCVTDNGEEFLEAIEDENEINRIADIFEERLQDFCDIVEED